MSDILISVPAPPSIILSSGGASVILASIPPPSVILTGAGAQGPAGVNAAIAVLSPTALASNTNDWNINITTGFSFARISATGAVNLTGIAGGVAGYLLILKNVGANTITLVDSSGLSLAQNRFVFSFGNTLLGANNTIALISDGNNGWNMA
jgi:hypothetical protein